MLFARQVFSNTAWQILGKVATVILGIINVMFVTKYLAPSDYGQYTTIYDFTALFAIIADFGLFTIAVREMAHDENHLTKIYGNVLSVRLFLAFLAMGLAASVGFLIPPYQETRIPLGVFIVSGSIVLALMAGTISSVLQVKMAMRRSALALTLGKVFTVLYIFVIITFLYPNDVDRGFPHLFLAWIFGGMLTLLIMYLSARRYAPVRLRFDFSYWKSVILKALPYGLALLLGTIYFRMGTIMMSFYGLQEEIGYYGVPLRILENLIIIPAFFMNSLLPVLTRDLKEKSELVRQDVQYAFNTLFFLAFPVLIGGVILAKPIILFITGSTTYLEGHSVGGSDLGLQIMLIANTLTFLHVVFGYTLVALGKQSKLLWLNALAVVANIASNLFLIPRFGFLGAAFTSILSELIILVGGFFFVKYYLSMVLRWSFALKVIFSSFIMGIGMFLLREPLAQTIGAVVNRPQALIILVPEVFLGILLYIGCLFLLRGITPDMITFLRKPKTEKSSPESSGAGYV